MEENLYFNITFLTLVLAWDTPHSIPPFPFYLEPIFWPSLALRFRICVYDCKLVRELRLEFN